MCIEEDLKFGFKDVFICLKCFIFKSCFDVELECEFIFKYLGLIWFGVLIIVVNMDIVGIFSMVKVLVIFGILIVVYKYYIVEEWLVFIQGVFVDVFKYVMVFIGMFDVDFEKIQQIFFQNLQLNFVCIDVVNGYFEYFVQFVVKVCEVWL